MLLLCPDHHLASGCDWAKLPRTPEETSNGYCVVDGLWHMNCVVCTSKRAEAAPTQSADAALG